MQDQAFHLGGRMRGDQLARQCQVARTTEASLNGLTVAEIAKSEETGIPTSYRDLEALQAAKGSLNTERPKQVSLWAFIGTFKFRIPALYTSTELISPRTNKDLLWVLLKTNTVYDPLEWMKAFKE